MPFALQLTYYEFAKEELEQLDNGMSASSMTTSSSDSADDSGQGITDDHRGQDQRSGESAMSSAGMIQLLQQLYLQQQTLTGTDQLLLLRDGLILSLL